MTRRMISPQGRDASARRFNRCRRCHDARRELKRHHGPPGAQVTILANDVAGRWPLLLKILRGRIHHPQASTPEAQPPPPPPATPASVLSYKRVRVDGRLLSGEIRIWRRARSNRKKESLLPSLPLGIPRPYSIPKGSRLTHAFFVDCAAYFFAVPGSGFLSVAAASRSATLGIVATAARLTSRSTSV